MSRGTSGGRGGLGRTRAWSTWRIRLLPGGAGRVGWAQRYSRVLADRFRQREADWLAGV